MYDESQKKKIMSLSKEGFFIYPDSFWQNNLLFFTIKNKNDKYLGIAGNEEQITSSGFSSRSLPDMEIDKNGYIAVFVERNRENLGKLIEIFPSLNPSSLGQKASFGFGDRLGLATSAHARIVRKNNKVLPVFAQQSVRELDKTGRRFSDVVDDAMWNIIQEGYNGIWGADADHIKDLKYFKIAVEEGMTMFTLDTAEVLDEKVLGMSAIEIRSNYDLDSIYIKQAKIQYENKICSVGSYNFNFDEEVVVRLALTYGRAIDFASDIFQFLKEKKNNFDYEVSFDETKTITSPEAHYFIATQMKEKGIDFSSLALRFPGTFEKGVDYQGNIADFENSIRIHGEIARSIGGYRLSLHSGSDKFSIYPAFNRNTKGLFHIKTSGTSWLEAVRVIAACDPDFFRELFKITVNTFNENKKAYHVNLDYNELPKSIDHVKDEDLTGLIDDHNLRRAFHIAYGAILDREKERFYQILFENEDKHYQFIMDNLDKHFYALKNG